MFTLTEGERKRCRFGPVSINLTKPGRTIHRNHPGGLPSGHFRAADEQEAPRLAFSCGHLAPVKYLVRGCKIDLRETVAKRRKTRASSPLRALLGRIEPHRGTPRRVNHQRGPVGRFQWVALVVFLCAVNDLWYQYNG